ncbi:hypothetical protein [Clostridium sp.]|uniref:hypothetical protein n=1 Tax=Clostridium sp. TaxID=1506 RepID=UPI00321660BA
MNFKKLITNTLAVVGAVVIVDKIVNAVSNKSIKTISEALMNDNEDKDEDSDLCQCSFLDDDYEENLNACHCGEGEMDYEAFPDIKQYEDEDDNAFQYAIKTEPTTDTPKEV